MGRGPANARNQTPWLPDELVPTDFWDVGLLAELGRIKKGVASFAVGARRDLVYPFEERLAAGEVELELIGQGSLAERIRAAPASPPSTPRSVPAPPSPRARSCASSTASRTSSRQP